MLLLCALVAMLTLLIVHVWLLHQLKEVSCLSNVNRMVIAFPQLVQFQVMDHVNAIMQHQLVKDIVQEILEIHNIKAFSKIKVLRQVVLQMLLQVGLPICVKDVLIRILIVLGFPQVLLQQFLKQNQTNVFYLKAN